MNSVIIFTKDGGRHPIYFRKPQVIPEFVERVREEYGDEIKVMYLANFREATYPPPNQIIPRGYMWCPYCVAPRRYKPWDKNPEYLKCTVCGISDHDYHVRTANNLWRTLYSDKRGGRKRSGGKQGR